jgi:hypothetical protein
MSALLQRLARQDLGQRLKSLLLKQSAVVRERQPEAVPQSTPGQLQRQRQARQAVGEVLCRLLLGWTLRRAARLLDQQLPGQLWG